MSEIDQKLKRMKPMGVNPGAALGPETDAGFGGRRRDFENGTIYFHRNAGTHYISGGMKTVFDKNGGVDFDRKSRRREFGFPTSESILLDQQGRL